MKNNIFINKYVMANINRHHSCGLDLHQHAAH